MEIAATWDQRAQSTGKRSPVRADAACTCSETTFEDAASSTGEHVRNFWKPQKFGRFRLLLLAVSAFIPIAVRNNRMIEC